MVENNNKRTPSVVVIGAGMTGILATIKLREAGITDITILEKKAKVGGTWRENTYPGVACDVPAHMYTYSFEQNPNWSNYFARGPEIQKYFEGIADKYAVTGKVRFNEAVTGARYDNGKWTVETSQGNTFIADFVISATGILHHPSKPDIEGLDSFQGDMFHTAEWDHSVEIGKGKRVGVIGTGSTAAQFIPELVKTGADVSVFMRTPQWLLPMSDFTIPEWAKAMMRRFPFIPNLFRNTGKFTLEHFFTKAVTGHKPPKFILETACKLNLRFSIKDSVLREKLRPNYQVGCKRVVINTTYYKAIQKSNSHLITESIERITEKGIVTRDGKLHELDVLVLSTGFKPLNFMRPMNLVGKNGLHIDDAWGEKIQAYRSVLLPDFPNFFLMLGPYTPIGNFSVIAMSEVQMNYVLKLIERWRNREFDELEPCQKAIERFNGYVKDGVKNTSWVGGCNSWYLDGDGDPILWPYTWKQWVKEMAEPDMNDLMTLKTPESQHSIEVA
ncbi:NAD(P)/FAD-dependent oxidoreductase [Parendozoicomonas sp. Alg238-R29]|uniref:flavin-containing monooxygenase n=1 Tax=Parendozoicomonas sp. Alg238-R29 TaxID=2993446 RepID=UPI00248E3879|nr:NAD(P)/FAD-dependent oxidoreductase [Parendozoicomonas sp. Alg238-R29]